MPHQPLYSPRLIQRRLPPSPVPAEHKAALHAWAATIRDGSIRREKETEIRGAFIRRLFVEVLGYRQFADAPEYTISDEKRTGAGSADAALGHFSVQGKRVLAPVELKGPNTTDLDAVMPGRHKSPVQQAWEYAMDTPGCGFVVVSNMVELRLYAVGHTRQAYERWNLVDVADSDAEYHRLMLLLGADHLLTGRTAALLAESAEAEREITARLYADYKIWRIRLLEALAAVNDRPPERLIGPVQKLLDRILFIAFAEDRGLLPAKTLHGAWAHRDPYNPRPLWDNFQGLFRSIDQGNPQLHIPAYNGGLFAHDPDVDSLAVPDEACAIFEELGGYDFASEVSVTVLGHIFEQSITDLEQLAELADTGRFELKAIEAQIRAKAWSVSGKRKREGIVYTPDAITTFIVERTLGGYIEARRLVLLTDYLDPSQPRAEDGAWRFRKPSKAEEDKHLRRPDRKARLKVGKDRLVEWLFWHAWRDTLADIKVCDPACGSGAFLVAAFDLLDAEYHRANEQLQAITGARDFFDINREILNANLYGVDINPESIEITKLSLWLKTARHGKPLESLEANLKVGNSLISPEDGGGGYDPRAFDWRAAFPEVFSPLPRAGEGGAARRVREPGFDVILGNPPYVRMERLKAVKPWLERHYAVASDRADLYAYFYELGVRLLRPGGWLGYISSSTFFKTGSGEPLRRYLLDHARLDTLVDFGDAQVFEGVTTYPAIVVLERLGMDRHGPVGPRDDVIASVAKQSMLPVIRFLVLGQALPESLAAEFEQRAQTIPQGRLGAGSWHLEGEAEARLRDKLVRGRRTLKEVYGAPLYGIKTGLNEAFVVDRATRDRLVAEDPGSAELLKPFLEGKDLKKWRVEPQDLWLIYIAKNTVDIDAYPAIRRHLEPYRDKLERRATKQAWFELQQAQAAYVEAMSKPKIG